MTVPTLPAADRAALADLYESTWRAMIGRACAELDRLLTDDFVLLHMTGMRQPKAAYLQSIADGTLAYFSARTERIDAVSLGPDRARVVGESRVEAAVFGGGRRTWQLRLTYTAVRSGGEWRFAHGAASTY